MIVPSPVLAQIAPSSPAHPGSPSGLTLDQIRQFLAHDVVAWVMGGLVVALVTVVFLWALRVADRQPSRLLTATVGAMVVVLGVVFSLRADAIGQSVPIAPMVALGLVGVVLLELCQGLSVRFGDVAHNLAQYLLLVTAGVVTVVLLTQNVDEAMWLLYGVLAGAGSYFAVLGPNRSVGRTIGRHFAPDGSPEVVPFKAEIGQVA